MVLSLVYEYQKSKHSTIRGSKRRWWSVTTHTSIISRPSTTVGGLTGRVDLVAVKQHVKSRRIKQVGQEIAMCDRVVIGAVKTRNRTIHCGWCSRDKIQNNPLVIGASQNRIQNNSLWLVKLGQDIRKSTVTGAGKERETETEREKELVS